MTVKELFNHFLSDFDRVVYFDEKNNIQDMLTYSECTATVCDTFCDMYNYGNRIVTEWEFDDIGNTIYVKL